MAELFVIERMVERGQGDPGNWEVTNWCKNSGDTAVNAARGLAEAKKLHPDALYRIRPLGVN